MSRDKIRVEVLNPQNPDQLQEQLQAALRSGNVNCKWDYRPDKNDWVIVVIHLPDPATRPGGVLLPVGQAPRNGPKIQL
jgi:hypothetical protein